VAVDEIEEWTRAQARVGELVAGLSPEEAGRPVPACPAWSVRDLLSHMVGLDVDVLAGDEPDDHNAGWTQRQVDERRGLDVSALLEEWARTIRPLRAWMAEHGTRPMGDVVIHEQDLRGALGVPGARDSPGMTVLRDRFAGRLADRVAAAGLPPVALVGETWRSGPEDGAGAVLRASDFDLARAVLTRRSAAQLRGWAVAGDVTPYLPHFALLGPLPEADLTD
jgi:uncharacterized protein (TIGR03083 family)